MNLLVRQIAEAVKEAGGRAFLVGGCVRDEIMGLEPKDIDIEVYYLEPEKLKEVISKFGKVDAVGASFQVYKVGQDIDVSLPRRERKTSVGHKGFTVEGDPYMSFYEACSRRDFTINAIMKDSLTGEIIDPFNGQGDIKARRLRAISEKTFQEDSLRVLRLAQFASRFRFGIDSTTAGMAIATDLSDLPKERVWMEVEKLLMKSPDPSVGIGWLMSLAIEEKVFPALCLNIVVSSKFLMTALKRAPQFCNDLSYGEKLAVLCSLLASYSTTKGLDQLGLHSVAGHDVRGKVEVYLRLETCLFRFLIINIIYYLKKFP